jgi:hypothetical protein
MAKEVWKAIAYLYPNAQINVDYNLEVVGDADPVITAWSLPQPQPTTQEIDAAIAAYDAAKAQQASDTATLRASAVSVLQSVVGVTANNWTAAQVRALVLALLYEHEPRAVNPDTSVRPLAQWLK